MSAAADLVSRSRAAQGLPPRVTDPAVLAKVAAILAGARRDEAPVHQAGAPVNNTITTFVATSPKGGRRVPN